MKPANYMSKEDFNEINRVRGARASRSVHKGYSAIKTQKPAISAVQKLLGLGEGQFHEGGFRIAIEIYGPIRGDIDNVLKGILDSLNGIAYSDDKQCVEARVKLCESDNNV